GGRRPGHDGGGQRAQRPAAGGQRDGPRRDSPQTHFAARGVRRGSLPCEPAGQIGGAGKAGLLRIGLYVTSRDEQRVAERVVQGMIAKDAFSEWLGVEPLETAPP